MRPFGIILARLIVAAILVLSATGSVRAQDAVPADALARIKAATVYVRSTFKVPESKAPLEGGGSGFVVESNGTDVLVATNSHVVTYDLKESADIKLVFRSGTSREVTVPATIVARDADRDLAILKAAPATPPAPLDLGVGAPLQETATVYIFGFPFGKVLAEREGNPEITVGRGSVSSIRRDEFDRILHVQINGDINPGNSGGPLVDTAGRLTGIAVAHRQATQIGYAIPAALLLDTLQGRVTNVVMRDQSASSAQRLYRITADVIDPLHKLSGAVLMLIRQDKVGAPPKPDARGDWAQAAPDMLAAPLTISGRTAAGTVTLPVATQESTPYFIQLRFTRATGNIGGAAAAGEVVYGMPRLFHVAPTSDWLTQPVTADAPHATDAAASSAASGRIQPAALPAYAGRVRDPSAAVAPTMVGRSEPGGQALGGAVQDLPGATVTPLRLDAELLLPAMAWSGDGRSFYVVQQHLGILRKIGLKSLAVERQIDLGGLCTGIARSADGLIMTMQSKDELWVLDESSLEIKSRFHVPDLLAAASAPPMKMAWTICGGPRFRRIDVLDLHDGKIVKSYDMDALRTQAATGLGHEAADRSMQAVDDFRLSPDGKYLFVVSDRLLHRLVVNGAELRYEEAGPGGVGRQERIEISDDSRYVALVNGGGNTGTSRYPAPEKYGTYVFRIDDLQSPIVGLRQGAFASCLAMCKATHRLYGQNSDSQLILFKPDGTREREYALSMPGDLTQQILPTPDGRGALVLTQSQLFWVEFKP